MTIAFFGATGGCANACLAHTLKAGYKATALARTPSKLITQLHAQGIDDETLDKNLTIVQGDATDVAAAKRVIAPEQNNNNNGAFVSTIVSGLGGSPKVQNSLSQPITLDNPHICEMATRTLVSAARELLHQSQEQGREQGKPLLTIISTTGISSGKQDVPLGLRLGGYHYMLSVPHEDKRKMEDLAFSSMDNDEDDDNNNNNNDNDNAPFRGVVAVRPTILTGDQAIGSGIGWQSLRAGTEADPALGYTVSRADVGEWIFEQVVRTGGEKWVNHAVSLTA